MHSRWSWGEIVPTRVRLRPNPHPFRLPPLRSGRLAAASGLPLTGYAHKNPLERPRIACTPLNQSRRYPLPLSLLLGLLASCGAFLFAMPCAWNIARRFAAFASTSFAIRAALSAACRSSSVKPLLSSLSSSSWRFKALAVFVLASSFDSSDQTALIASIPRCILAFNPSTTLASACFGVS